MKIIRENGLRNLENDKEKRKKEKIKIKLQKI